MREWLRLARSRAQSQPRARLVLNAWQAELLHGSLRRIGWNDGQIDRYMRASIVVISKEEGGPA